MSWAPYEANGEFPAVNLIPVATVSQVPKVSQNVDMFQRQIDGNLMPQMPQQLEGKQPVTKGKKEDVPKAVEKWQDISEYENVYDWLFITIAVIVVEVIVICLVRFCPELFGKSLNVWYNRFKLSAVLADILIIMIGFGISRYIYSEFVYPTYDWNPIYFTGVTVFTQLIHDILFYVGIIRPMPYGQNAMIDVFKEYAEAGGYKILGADSLMVIGSSIGAMLLKSAPLHITVSIGLLSAYVVPYILETKNSFSNIS